MCVYTCVYSCVYTCTCALMYNDPLSTVSTQRQYLKTCMIALTSPHHIQWSVTHMQVMTGTSTGSACNHRTSVSTTTRDVSVNNNQRRQCQQKPETSVSTTTTRDVSVNNNQTSVSTTTRRQCQQLPETSVSTTTRDISVNNNQRRQCQQQPETSVSTTTTRDVSVNNNNQRRQCQQQPDVSVNNNQRRHCQQQPWAKALVVKATFQTSQYPSSVLLQAPV